MIKKILIPSVSIVILLVVLALIAARLFGLWPVWAIQLELIAKSAIGAR